MQVGDLIKIKECLTITGNNPIKKCCFLCAQNSSRVGLVIFENILPKILDTTCWSVLFDVGPWSVYQSDIDEGDVEGLNESR